MQFRTLLCALLSATIAMSALAGRQITEEPVLFSDQPGAQKSRVRLPVLTEGPGTDYSVWYERKHFHAMVGRNGALGIQIKDEEGKPIDDVFWVAGAIGPTWAKPIRYEVVRGKKRIRNRSVHRSPIKWTSKFAPTDKPKGVITIKADCMDDTKFIRTYRFNGDRIDVGTGFLCKNKYYPSQNYICAATFGKCMNIKPSVELEERGRMLAGYELFIHGMKGRKKARKVFPFHLNTKFLSPAKKVETVGPWGTRKFTSLTKKFTQRPHLYKGNCPYQGYRVQLSVSGRNSLATGKQGYFSIVITP